MKITKNDVEQVALLARLKFSDTELETFTHQLNRILEYFEQLQNLDTTGIKPSTHAVNICNVFREDVVKGSLAEQESLKNAPSSRDNCFEVPKIIEG